MSRSSHSLNTEKTPLPKNKQFHDLTECRFGRLVVLHYTGKKEAAHTWLCRCDCGKDVVVFGSNLPRGNTKSCGCLHSEVTIQGHTIHGYNRATGPAPEYSSHQGLLSRCYNPKNISYHLYGGRGVRVCERWRNGDGIKSAFECFIADMGLKPSKRHSIDRMDNNGNYEPGNCRWATPQEQSSNTRRNTIVVFRGEQMILAQAIRVAKLNHFTVMNRLRRGWGMEAAINTPVRKFRPANSRFLTTP